MTTSLKVLLSVSLMVVLAACGDDTVPPVPADMNVAPDAADDAATDDDAGPVDDDAGPVDDDAGSTDDAGPVDTDAGPTDDAGTAADAG